MYDRVRSLFRKGDRRGTAGRDSSRAKRRPDLERLEGRTLLTGTWTKLNKPFPNGDGMETALLLSDGTVMASGGQGFASKDWYKLTPDSTGSYQNGTWTKLAPMGLERLFYASVVMPDGRIFVAGGEYSGPNSDPSETNTGEIYDPVADKWTPIANYPEDEMGDQMAEMLDDGTIITGSFSTFTYIYNPKTDTWSKGPELINGDSPGEEGWVKLGDGSILNYEIEGSKPQTGMRLLFDANGTPTQWVAAGDVPVALDSNGGNNGIVPELGPAFLLHDGRAFWIGATENTAFYATPTAAGNATGTWTAGPVQLDANGAPIGAFDSPGAVEPNGKVLWAASPIDGNNFPGPKTFLELDPATNTISRVTATGPDLSVAGFTSRMLALPSGQIMFTTGTDSDVWLYNPDSPQDNTAAPTVTKITTDGAGTFTLTGTQLMGLSEGAGYGDDAQMATNYPIIKLTDSRGVVSFARTKNWSSAWVGPAAGASQTVEFTLPGGFQAGSYTLNVITNGVSSQNFTFNTHLLGLRATPPTNAFEATTFSSQVAVFTDPVARDISSYTATIDWGDGQVSNGTVQLIKGSGANATYAVIGQHQYPQGGNVHYTVTVTTSDGAEDQDDTDLLVKGLPLSVTTTPLQLREGDTFTAALAHFTDTAPAVRSASFYSSTIVFGDGGTGIGRVVASPGGGFDVFDASGHVYGGGDYTLTINITKPGLTTTAQTTARVQDSPLTAEGLAATPVEGKPFTGPVATFTDADPRLPGPSNYFATIDWGDGTQTAGTIIANPSGPGFAVTGSHPYGVGAYATVVTIGNFSGGSTAVALGSADVADAPLDSRAYNFQPSAGATFTGFVASFTDQDPRPNPATHYQATINWGDGTTSTGQIIGNEDGGYLVQASHAYRPGLFTISTTVSDVGGSASTAQGLASVPDAPVTLSPLPTASASEGVPSRTPVATFETPNLLAVASDYSATIQFGDGTTAAGDVFILSTGAATRQFDIALPDKVYDAAGNYAINVILTSPGGSQLQTGTTLTVTAAPVTASGTPVVGVSKTPLTNVTVATFRSANPNAKASAYGATINWGDGTAASAGSIVPDGLGNFLVQGGHTFAGGGSYTTTVTISGNGLASAVLGSASISNKLFTISGGASTGNGGAISETGLTTSSQPIFSGTAEPGATVQIVATADGGQQVAIGTGHADATGAYSITATTPLGDGRYVIMASATDRLGRPSSAATVLYPTASRGELTVDTQGPKVSSARLDPRTGKVTLTLTDALSGLGQGTLQAANFQLRTTTGKVYNVTGLTVSPVSPNTQQTVTLTFGGGKGLPKGKYVLAVNAPGVADAAGNPLDERYFVPFPGFYNTPGQNFVAAFNSNGKTASLPVQYIPPPEVAAAVKHGLFVRKHFRR